MKILTHLKTEAARYAAEELLKYIKLITKCDIVPEIEYTEEVPSLSEGDIILSHLCDLSLDESDLFDPFVEDIIDIDIKNCSGYIAGSNDRSILMGVYRYCTSAGCRFIRPGENGEYIPYCDLSDHSYKYRHKADYPFRGECSEGAISYEHMRDTVYWLPKVGMNMYMIEGLVPYTYMHKWYGHEANRLLRTPGQVTELEMLEEYIAKLEKDIVKTGMQFHNIGHGWMFEKLGVKDADPKSESEAMAKLTKEQLEMTALVNGQRGLYKGSTFYTHFCYSNPAARKTLVDFCVEYVQRKPYVDFLHIWLADSTNNQCECENCVKMTPSDHFVILLNEIEEALSAIGSKTRLVFIMYVDTVRPPEKERLKNPERFTIVAAIGQHYENGYIIDEYKGEIPPFVRNQYKSPSSSLYLHYYKKWKELCGNIPGFVFEYRFYTDHYCDLGHMRISREAHRDMRSIEKINFQGCISDQTHRSFFPTSLPLTLLGETLWDKTVDFESFADAYFLDSYGEDGLLVREYLEKISENMCPSNLRNARRLAVDDQALVTAGKLKPSFIGNPQTAEKFAAIPAILDEFMPMIKKNMAIDDASQRLSWTYLYYHSKICRTTAEIFRLGSENKLDEAKARLDRFEIELAEMEPSIHNVFDLFLYIKFMRERFGIKMVKYFQ